MHDKKELKSDGNPDKHLKLLHTAVYDLHVMNLPFPFLNQIIYKSMLASQMSPLLCVYYSNADTL